MLRNFTFAAISKCADRNLLYQPLIILQPYPLAKRLNWAKNERYIAIFNNPEMETGGCYTKKNNSGKIEKILYGTYMDKPRPILQQLSLDQLMRGKYQPRRHFDPVQLQELADSIKTTGGLLQPIIVRPLGNNKYEIIAGERRWRAAQLAGLPEIACLVSQYSDEQALQAALIENINRADLNPIEEAQAYQRLIDEFQYLHDEVAAAVGKSRTTITNALRLLKLDARVQEFISIRKLSEGHGKILAGIAAAHQFPLAERCIQKGWSVRKLESEAKKLQHPEAVGGRFNDANIKHLETALSDHVGNRVHIDCEDRGGGFVKIRFNNVDELEGHFQRLGFKYEN
jgi:ParB family chromosome partitioning protein